MAAVTPRAAANGAAATPRATIAASRAAAARSTARARACVRVDGDGGAGFAASFATHISDALAWAGSASAAAAAGEGGTWTDSWKSGNSRRAYSKSSGAASSILVRKSRRVAPSPRNAAFALTATSISSAVPCAVPCASTPALPLAPEATRRLALAAAAWVRSVPHRATESSTVWGDAGDERWWPWLGRGVDEGEGGREQDDAEEAEEAEEQEEAEPGGEQQFGALAAARGAAARGAANWCC